MLVNRVYRMKVAAHSIIWKKDEIMEELTVQDLELVERGSKAIKKNYDEVKAMMIFSPFPEIETEQLLLRRMELKDIQDIFQMRNDSRMNEYTDTKKDESTEETRAYINKMNKGIEENKWVIWAIEHKQLGKVIGSISIWNIDLEQSSGELGYGIIPDYQGKGLMREALLSVVDYGFNIMRLRSIEAFTEENNFKSTKLLECCKFVPVNRVDDKGHYRDRIYHMIVYRLENINLYE